MLSLYQVLDFFLVKKKNLNLIVIFHKIQSIWKNNKSAEMQLGKQISVLLLLLLPACTHQHRPKTKDYHLHWYLIWCTRKATHKRNCIQFCPSSPSCPLQRMPPCLATFRKWCRLSCKADTGRRWHQRLQAGSV